MIQHDITIVHMDEVYDQHVLHLLTIQFFTIS
jgi:hypothetical protein